MSTLAGSTIHSRFKSLLKMAGSANDEISAALALVEDGDGNASPLSLAINKVLLKPTVANQIDMLDIQNALGTSVLKVDTSNKRVGINAQANKSLQVDNITLEGNDINTVSGVLEIGGSSGVEITNVSLLGTNTAVGLTMTASSINSTPIGASVPSSGKFSSLNINSAYSLPTDAGTATYVMTSDGAGGASWAASTGGGGGGGGSLTIKEQDNSPTVADVVTLVVTNGSLTDNGGGVVTLDTSAGAHTHNLSQITDSGAAAALDVGAGSGQVAAGDHTHAAFYYHPLTDPEHKTPLEPENDAYHWIKDTPFFNNMQEQYHLMLGTQCTSGTPATNQFHGDLASVTGGQPGSGSGAGGSGNPNVRYNEATGLGTFFYKHGEPPFLQGSVGNGTNYPTTVPSAEQYLERALWSTDFVCRMQDSASGQFPQDNAVGSSDTGNFVVSAHQILNISAAIGFLGSNHALMAADLEINYVDMSFTDPQPRWKHYWDVLDACLSYWEGKSQLYFEALDAPTSRVNQHWAFIKACFLAHKYLGRNKLSGIADGSALVGDSKDYDGLAERFYLMGNRVAGFLSQPYYTSNGNEKSLGYSSWSGYLKEGGSEGYHTNHLRDLAHCAIVTRNYHIMKILEQMTEATAQMPLVANGRLSGSSSSGTGSGEGFVGNIRRDGTMEIAATMFPDSPGMTAIALSQAWASTPLHAINTTPYWTIMPWSEVYGVDWKTHQETGGVSSEWPQLGVCAPWTDASTNWKNRGQFRPMVNIDSGGSANHRFVVDKVRMLPIMEQIYDVDSTQVWDYSRWCLTYYLVEQPTPADLAEFQVYVDDTLITHWTVGYYKYGGNSATYDYDVTDGKLSCNKTDAAYASLPAAVEAYIDSSTKKGVYMVRAYPKLEANHPELMDIGTHRLEIRPLDNGKLAISGFDNLLLENSVSVYNSDFLFGCSGERYHGSTYCQGVREAVNFYNQLELSKYVNGVPAHSYGNLRTRKSLEMFKYNWTWVEYDRDHLNQHNDAGYIVNQKQTLDYKGANGWPDGFSTSSPIADAEDHMLQISGYNWRLKNINGSASNIVVTPLSKVNAEGTTGGAFAHFTVTNSVDTPCNIRIGDCKIGSQYKYQVDGTGAWTFVEAWHDLGGVIEFSPSVADDQAFEIKVLEI